jgi:hypothetical protein
MATAAFDPDAYLAAPTTAPAAGGFDPDAYLAAPAAKEKPGIMARIGAGAAGLVTGAAEMAGLTAPVEIAEMAAGRQPAPHFGAPGPFGATAEQVRGVEQQTRGVTPGGLVKGAVQGIVQPFQTIGRAFTEPPQTLGRAYDVGKAVPQAVATVEAGSGALKGIGRAAARIPVVARTAERMAAAGEAKVAGLNEAAAAKNELISEAKRLKFKLTPQQADSGVVGKVAASVAGRAQLEREFSIHNAENARVAAAADVGITGQLTATSVAQKIQETLPAYLTPRTFGKMNLAEDSVWQSKLEEIRGISKQAEIDFPDDVAPAIQEEIKKFDRRIVDANSVIEKIASLRGRAADNFATNTSGAKELARTQRKLADELENALERHGEKIGQKGAVQTFRNARRQLAKLYTIRDSMTPAGDIDLGELAKRYHADEKLDGNLATMAKLKIEFDRSFQPPKSVRSHVVGAGDVALGAGALAATGQIGPAAIVAARPATRMVLGSPLYQKYAIGPKIAKPSLAARAARGITNLSEGVQSHTLGGIYEQKGIGRKQAQTESIPVGGGVRGVAGVLDGPGRTNLGYDKPLAGLPAVHKVDGKEITFGPLPAAREAAERHAKASGIPYNPPTQYAKVDPKRATRIADAYAEMRHDPTNPKVQASYQAMVKETIAQWQEIKKTGLKVEFIDGPDPYGSNPRKAILDVQNNNHLWVYPTDSGYGEGTTAKDFNIKEQPLLQIVDGETISGRPVRANDIFRIVHDYFGHIKEGVGFRAEGEENAWRSHAGMYSDAARPAMTSETRGQNSWVNYGPHAEFNKTASGADTKYAPQKIGLMPDWSWTEGIGDSLVKPKKTGRPHTFASTISKSGPLTVTITKGSKENKDQQQ